MSVIVTLDMYSGLPNPSWEITDSEAKKINGTPDKKSNAIHRNISKRCWSSWLSRLNS